MCSTEPVPPQNPAADAQGTAAGRRRTDSGAATFTVNGLTGYGLRLRATGQRPHYDVVYEGNDLESLVARLGAAPYRIVDNPSVDREEH